MKEARHRRINITLNLFVGMPGDVHRDGEQIRLPGAWREGVKTVARKYGVSFWGDGNVLKLDSVEGFTFL